MEMSFLMNKNIFEKIELQQILNKNSDNIKIYFIKKLILFL